VDGRDVMEALGISPGPLVGVILEELLETVLADPEQNNKEMLLRIARRLYEERIEPR
jgi:tRNA nucleotidyltransferase (CCA-adding enzyme)